MHPQFLRRFAFSVLVIAPTLFPATLRARADEPLDRLVDAAVKTSLERLARSTEEVGTAERYPTYATQEQKWKLEGSSDWTSGFYPGCLWLAFDLSGDARFERWAQQWTAPIEHEKNNRDTHDLGFRFMCTFGQGLRLGKGDAYARYPAVLHEAAATLAHRFNPRIGALSSNWDRDPLPHSVPVVIDIMMNLELLLWSASHGGPADYVEMARRHTDTTLRDFVRADGGTYHVVRYDERDGSILNRGTLQGAGPETTWSRGHAWAQYGCVVMYRATKEPRYLQAAQRLTDYFLAHLPPDHVSAWDFQSDIAYRDVSATAIVAAGLFELVKYVEESALRAKYQIAAEAMLRSLCQPPYFASRADTNCLLDHSVQYLPIGSNVDVPAIFADYYFLEAILRYRASR
ncbi:glycoside hydrolase family 88 protein [Opitutus terrae]|uniref:Glycosyl hydrolase family 88 n=1 Tax=Opitutus terrae (strain DSM 11246 / JCM 15787 / PB90-1) TaxID=452637 RepID=B1ZQC6_OPITP|nr:glycoside hydrolase family 88 protein [Opitutus terrae]ACB73606.1 glycosyl hydrolase family 88 [Opitutus terrae PB90-1]